VNSLPPFTQQDLEKNPHAAILAEAPPKGAEAPYHMKSSILPKQPFCLYDEGKRVVKLHFETSSLWIEGDGVSDRVLYADLQSYRLQELPESRRGYWMLELTTGKWKKLLYYIPQQYSGLVNTIIHTRNGASPPPAPSLSFYL
jgi:hypothetical protein